MLFKPGNLKSVLRTVFFMVLKSNVKHHLLNQKIFLNFFLLFRMP